MLFVSHSSLNDDWKAITEIGGVGGMCCYSNKLGGALPTSRRSRPLGRCINSRYSPGGMSESPETFSGDLPHDEWPRAPFFLMSLVGSSFTWMIGIGFEKIYQLYATVFLTFLPESLLLVGIVESDSLYLLSLFRCVQSGIRCRVRSDLHASVALFTRDLQLVWAGALERGWASAVLELSSLAPAAMDVGPSTSNLRCSAIAPMVFVRMKDAIERKSSSLWSCLLPSASAALPASKYLSTCLSIVSESLAVLIWSMIACSAASYTVVQVPLWALRVALRKSCSTAFSSMPRVATNAFATWDLTSSATTSCSLGLIKLSLTSGAGLCSKCCSSAP